MELQSNKMKDNDLLEKGKALIEIGNSLIAMAGGEESEPSEEEMPEMDSSEGEAQDLPIASNNAKAAILSIIANRKK